METIFGRLRSFRVTAIGSLLVAAAMAMTAFPSTAAAQEQVTFINNTTREVFVYLQFGPSSDGTCATKQYNKRFLMESSEFRRWNLGPDPVCYCYSVAGWPTAEDCQMNVASPGDTVNLQ